MLFELASPFPPLPPGEGRGEEKSFRFDQISSFSTEPVTLPSPLGGEGMFGGGSLSSRLIYPLSLRERVGVRGDLFGSTNSRASAPNPSSCPLPSGERECFPKRASQL